MVADQLFKALSDPTRLRCLVLLVNHDELCVCEFTHTLNLPQPKISHHLATLRRAGLVSDRKAGLWVYYRLNESLPAWVVEVLRSSAAGVAAEEPYGSDELTLQQMSNRPGAACSACPPL